MVCAIRMRGWGPKQAIASLMRIGRVAPDVLLAFVTDKTPLREFTYYSVEANSERTVKITVSDLRITGLYDADGMKLNGIVSAYRDARRKEPKSRLRITRRGPPVARQGCVYSLKVHPSDQGHQITSRMRFPRF